MSRSMEVMGWIVVLFGIVTEGSQAFALGALFLVLNHIDGIKP